MNSVASKKGDVSVLFEPPNENIVVEADKERISQVVRNILSNALEFTNEGNVLVTLRKERQQEKERAQIAVVTVTDTGCGIDSAVMPKIFEKFVTRWIRVLVWGYSYQKVLYRRTRVKSGSKTIQKDRKVLPFVLPCHVSKCSLSKDSNSDVYSVFHEIPLHGIDSCFFIMKN